MVQDLYGNMPKEIKEYLEIRELTKTEQYEKASGMVKASSISESTRNHLQTVLASGEKYVVDRTINELDGRLAQALCWACWRR